MPSEFAVVFTAPATGSVVQQLKNLYPSAYELVENRVYLIRDGGLTSDIAVKLGIKSKPSIAEGVVFKLNHAYSGFTARTLWEWLGE